MAGLPSDDFTILLSGRVIASNPSYSCWGMREYLLYFYFTGGPVKPLVLPLCTTDEDLVHCCWSIMFISSVHVSKSMRKNDPDYTRSQTR